MNHPVLIIEEWLCIYMETGLSINLNFIIFQLGSLTCHCICAWTLILNRIMDSDTCVYLIKLQKKHKTKASRCITATLPCVRHRWFITTSQKLIKHYFKRRRTEIASQTCIPDPLMYLFKQWKRNENCKKGDILTLSCWHLETALQYDLDKRCKLTAYGYCIRL